MGRTGSLAKPRLWLRNALTTNELVVIISAAVSPREEPGPLLEPPGG